MMPRAASAGGKVKDEPLSPGGGNDRKVGEEEREKRKERKGEELMMHGFQGCRLSFQMQ